MKFLTKLGQILLKGTAILTGLQTLPYIPAKVQAIEGTIVSDLKQIAAIIATVESMGQVAGLPGADKLKAAGPLVAQAILQSDLMINHKIQNAALFNQGATKIADGMADVLNSLKVDGLGEENKA